MISGFSTWLVSTPRVSAHYHLRTTLDGVTVPTRSRYLAAPPRHPRHPFEPRNSPLMVGTSAFGLKYRYVSIQTGGHQLPASSRNTRFNSGNRGTQNLSSFFQGVFFDVAEQNRSSNCWT